MRSKGASEEHLIPSGCKDSMVKSDLPDRLRSTAGYLIKLIVSKPVC